MTLIQKTHRRKVTKTTMTRKMDTLCSQIIRFNPCAKCGEVDYSKLQCAHIFSRTYKSVRWDLLNLLCLCASCHFWAHKNPVLFGEFVASYLGEAKYSELKGRARALSRHTLSDLMDIYSNLYKVRKEQLECVS